MIKISEIALTRAEFRYREDASRLFFWYYEFTLKWKPEKSWIIAPTYRQVRKVVGVEEKWRNEASPYLDVIKKWKPCDFHFSVRNRLIWLDVNREWFWRIRGKVLTPWELSKLKLKPYFSNEFFFESGKRYCENRLEGGLELPIKSWLKGSFAYILLYREVAGNWKRIDVLVTHLNWKF